MQNRRLEPSGVVIPSENRVMMRTGQGLPRQESASRVVRQSRNLSDWFVWSTPRPLAGHLNFFLTLAAGAFRSRPLIALILSICIVRIFFCISAGILCHYSNRSLYDHNNMAEMCVQNGVLHNLVCIHFKYHAEETATSPVVQGMLYCSCSK